MSKKHLLGALALLITTTAFGCASAPTASQVATPAMAQATASSATLASTHERKYSTKWVGAYGYGGCGGCGYGGYGYGGYGYGGCGGYGSYALGYGLGYGGYGYGGCGGYGYW